LLLLFLKKEGEKVCGVNGQDRWRRRRHRGMHLERNVLLAKFRSLYIGLSELLRFPLNYFGAFPPAPKQGWTLKRVYLSSVVAKGAPYCLV